jgi:hypothetical protein
LRTHRTALERLAALLQSEETVDGAEVEHVLATSRVEGPEPEVPRSGRPALPEPGAAGAR